ncbi:MAG: cytochrome c1 [Paracoccaceae bacterium]|jgi:ubiquinol-cytochrome c reductase cytochrome c1 subunit|nr:cytochrome c1 [Paracoccaceae bacterium]
MFRNLTLSVIAALGLTAGEAMAAGPEGQVTDYDFSFEGPFGTYDQMQLQRGMQVFTEICSACHGLRYVPFRTLGDPGGPDLPDDQVRAYAEMFEVYDPELDDGFGGFRPATPVDHYPESQFEGAPDLSLMAKARAGFSGPYGTGLAQLFKGMGGPEYIASYLGGYTGEDRMEAGTLLYENTVFPGGWTQMAPVFYGDDVVYEDGTEATIEQQAQDVAAFLMWTAEPKMMARKQTGFVAVIFLGVLTVLLYLTNKRLWAPIKHRAKETPAE